MTAALITAVIITAGAYLWWAVQPVRLAFTLGRLFERIQRIRARGR
jgi:hypothetical protein